MRFSPTGRSHLKRISCTRDILTSLTVPTAKDLCSCKASKVKIFEPALVQAKVIYNRYGWHDPQGRFFVLKEELERHGGLEAYIQKVENRKSVLQTYAIPGATASY